MKKSVFKPGISLLFLAALSTNLSSWAEAAKPGSGAPAKAGSVTKSAAQTGPDWEPMLKTAWQLNLTSETEAANSKAQEALQLAEKKQDSKGMIASLNVQADLLDSQGKIPEQLEIRKRALAIAESKYGNSSPEFARQLAKMGSYYARKGEQGQARADVDQAMQILANDENKYPHEMSVCKLGVARRLFSEGSFGLADDAFASALQLQDKTGKPELFEVLQIAREYAALLDQLGRKDEAVKLKDRINLVKVGSGLGEPANSTATKIGAAASSSFLKIVEQARANSGDRAKCMALWRQALQEAEKAGNDKKIAFVLVHLADEYRYSKQDDEAGTLLKKAIGLREKSSANETLGMARNLTRLAQLYMTGSKSQECESLLRKAVDIENKCKASNAMLASTLQYLISAAMLNKNNRQAEDAARQLITVADQQGGTAGKLHKQMAQSMLGSVYMQTGRMNEGLQLMKEISGSMGSLNPTETSKAYMDEFNETDKLVDESEMKEFS